MITGVAILRDGVIWALPRPARHCHVLWVMQRVLCWQPKTRDYGPLVNEERMEQGFVNERGEFLDREQGAEEALMCGQIQALRWPPDLYSEDLW